LRAPLAAAGALNGCRLRWRVYLDQLLGGQRALGSAQDLHHRQAKTHVAGVGRTGLVDLVDERVERGAMRFDRSNALDGAVSRPDWPYT